MRRTSASSEGTEEAVILVEVLITRRPDGDYLARMTIDEEAGWASCTAQDPFDALEGAAGEARRNLGARLRARRLATPPPH